MSPWEIFTWLNVGVLAVGPAIVFALFLRQLPALLGTDDSADAATDGRTNEGTEDADE